MIIASIDIGTNTVLLLIAKVANKNTIETILNEFRIPRIGRGLLSGQPIKEENLSKLFEVLKDYESIILENKCEKIIVIATHALRIASNSDEIISRIYNEFNWKVDVISGEEEAMYAFAGAVINRNPEQEYIVIDIGGGSTEIVSGNTSLIKYRKSFKTGVVNGTEKFLSNNPPSTDDIITFKNYLDETFQSLGDHIFSASSAIALAGTPTTLSCMKQNLEEYDEELVEGSILKIKDIEMLINEISKLSSNTLVEKYKSIVSGRQDIILAGSIILLKLIGLLKLPEVIVSTKGIRYGAIKVKVMDNLV